MITVIMPAYNAEAYIAETIESVLAQEYQDFKFLILDDGSTDNTADIIASFKDDRISMIQRENRGVTASLNELVSAAQSEWVVRQDADDISYPNRLGTIVDSIKCHEGDVMVYSFADYIQGAHKLGSYRTTVAEPLELSSYVRSGYLLSVCHPSVALRRSTILGLGGYRDYRHAEDADLWARLARVGNVRLIPERLLAMRINEESVSSKNLVLQHVNAIYVQYVLLSELWGYAPKPVEQVREVLETFVNPRSLRAKALIRNFAIAMAGRRYLSAVASLVGACSADPSFFFERVALEFGRPERPALNGVDPIMFASRAQQLWASK